MKSKQYCMLIWALNADFLDAYYKSPEYYSGYRFSPIDDLCMYLNLDI